MSIQTGDRIPAAEIRIMTDDGTRILETQKYFKGRNVVMFSLPGAFTPTCSAKHLPGYIQLADELLAKGVDVIACMSVNDAFVMDAWGKSAGADQIDMLADGNGDFAGALGLEVDSTAFGMGMRSQRFSLLAENGVIEKLFVEDNGEFRVSSAEHMLANI